MRAREPEIEYLLAQLTATGDGAPTIENKLELAAAIRAFKPDMGPRLDHFLLAEIEKLRCGLAEASEAQAKLRDMIDTLTAPPWHPAVFLRPYHREGGCGALVAAGSGWRLVNVADGVDAASLERGDPVMLSSEMNVILAQGPADLRRTGETAPFERYTGDGRLVLRAREEEMIVDASKALAGVELRNGDVVRYDRNAWLAMERIERAEGSHLFLEETPDVTFDQIGGLDRQLAALQRSIRLHMQHAETVRKYGVRRKGSVLFVGPPGTGKTMAARALANWMARLSEAGRSHFINVKPAALHSMWYSQSEANYREVFRVARDAAAADPRVPVVMFFDEVDAIGSSRGESLTRVDDRVLTAFMCELDGLESRGNILVAAATNRRDTLDPALLRPGRLGDLVLEIPRPNRRAAHEIFSKYLTASLPYAEGSGREDLIDAAVSRMYAPNAEGEIAVATLRNGKRFAIRPRDVASGAVISKIAQAAIERACVREVETGDAGLRSEDVLEAIADEMASAAAALTPANCRHHLEGVPQDVDVVRIEPAERKLRRPLRYMDLDPARGGQVRSIA